MGETVIGKGQAALPERARSRCRFGGAAARRAAARRARDGGAARGAETLAPGACATASGAAAYSVAREGGGAR